MLAHISSLDLNMSEVTTSLDPPKGKLDNYNASLPRHQQHGSFPAVFIEAMAIREEVFVREQGVPLENEYDDDDPRSAHFVTYASVANPAHVAGETPGAIRKPVGCIRVVPPPHAPHEHNHDELPAGTFEEGQKASAQQPPSSSFSHKNRDNEPYLKLGRLAVLQEYRGKGHASELIRFAETWAIKHAVVKFDVQWTGWVLIHAQVWLRDLIARGMFAKANDSTEASRRNVGKAWLHSRPENGRLG
jgi:predicted GNAT family N-acyltransferase